MLTLGEQEVHVHVLKDTPDLSAVQLETAATWLSSVEKARHDRYVFAHSRREFLLSRLLLRGTLSLYTGRAPGDHELLLGSRGKPFLDETIPPGGLSFSLTHSHGLLGLAVTKGRELGLDIEAVREKSDLLGLARHCFSPRELAALTALPPSEHGERFFALWTLKESYIKARGLGLSLPLDSFSFVLDPGTQPLGLTCEPVCEDDATRWRLWQLRLGDQHAAALTVAAGTDTPLTLRFFATQPDAPPIPLSTETCVLRR